MNKATIWYAAVLLLVYFTLVFCEETAENDDTQLIATSQYTDMDMESLLNAGRELLEFEGRTRRHRHHFWLRHLWPLAIAYWIKVKVVVVSFFVGSAIYLGLRYFKPSAARCPEIILDHPPSSFGHHDHIPYSIDHSAHESYDAPSYESSHSFDPYSGYSGYHSSSDIVSDVHSEQPTGPSGPSGPSGPPEHSDKRRRGKRSAIDDEQRQEELVELIDEEITESVARQQPAEEQIAEFMFAFLGLDTKACRRRFVCEMEFRSKLNPLTSMAFRIVGRGFFEHYTNARNPQSIATNFFECAAANPECIFIENTEPETEPTVQQEQEQEQTKQTEAPNTEDSQNEVNLEAERRQAQLRKRRGDRKLSSIAEHILTN